ncbi:PBP1A family penicillin-binding protein [Bartonella sp. TP]|uniref:transglycosylase domain-containing protein n=1 Tax=Bartonella sp. TP TaxID=3057550 RepID=UPI0025B14B6D|nr:PBP1A family penicillin-binding protein [Bartonella sp. TP]WJW80172.1 PBP1A family penicillin-binding protein [Bartonella sp. TP]
MLWPKKNKNKKFKSPGSDKLIAIDSLIDDSLFKIKNSTAVAWGILLNTIERYRLTGFLRAVIEITDEALTFLLIFTALFTILATSILQITKTDWYNKDHLSVTFLDRYNKLLGSRGTVQSQNVAIDQMPPYVVKAVLATEDRRFFYHYGIDLYGLSRALSQNLAQGGVVQGGSTLTQQLAKNMFLSNERTLVRKVKEAVLALWFERNYDKKQILQMYLNNAYMGGGAFGINAAAKFYFGKDIRQVSLAEAAMLAGLFKAPSKYAPHIHPEAAKERADVVLSNLVNSGFMNESEIKEARAHPAQAIVTTPFTSPDYFLDYAYEKIKEMQDKFNEHSLIVQTTLDPNIQEAAQAAVQYHLQQYGKSYNVSQAAVVVLSNDGSLRAMIGGKDYGESHFNRAVHGGRQAGSAFKPYVYAVVMERGLTPDTTIVDAPINWGGWAPRNDNGRFIGRINLTTALAYSINSVPVRLTYEFLHGDTQPIRDLIKNMGINADILAHKTMVLGTSNMTTMDQATGFNVFANGGRAGNRHLFLKISSGSGRLLWLYNGQENPMRQVMSAQSAAYMNQMMTQVVTRGSGHRAALENIPVAGKTGTSQAYRDAWFVGFTGDYTTAVWMGNDNYSPTNRLFGGILPAMIFHTIMEYAHRNIKLHPLFGVAQNISRPSNEPNEDTINYGNLGVLSPVSTDILEDINKALTHD